ncbi:MAG: FGGY family carbohydrate kinase [Christensenellales bacterium]
MTWAPPENKATLFDVEGNLIRSVTTPYETHFFNANWAEQNPQNWWEAFCASTKQLVCEIDAKEVAAVSFSGQMMGCVPVDMSGKAIRPAIIWADQRSTAQADALLEQIPAQEFYRITGHRASASYSIEKLMWIRDHEPDSFSRIYRTLQPKDYLVCKLTGRFVTDYSDASSTNALDLSTLTWSDEILKASKLDPSLFPDLMPSTAVIGELTASVAKECGLAAGTPIVLGAGDGVVRCYGRRIRFQRRRLPLSRILFLDRLYRGCTAV